MPKLMVNRIISRQEKQPDIAVIPLQPLGAGLKMEESVLPEQREEKEDTISQTSNIGVGFKKIPKFRKILIPSKGPFSMQESVQSSNAQISTDRSNFLKTDIRKGNYRTILDLDSTITEGDYNVSWEMSHRELSKKLWLPTLTDSVDTVSNSSNGSSENIMSNSWFSVKKTTQTILSGQKNLPRISWTSVTTSQPNITGENQLSLEGLEKRLRVRKYQIRLDNQMKQKVKKALKTTKYLYNQCVRLSSEGKVSLKILRRLLVTDCKENILPPHIKQKFKKIPYSVRDGALRDFISAYVTQIKMIGAGEKNHFRMTVMTNIYRSLAIQHKDLRVLRDNVITAFPHSWGGKISCKEQFPKIEHDVRLVRKGTRYFLHVPVPIEERQKIKTGRVVGLDPGVRVFQTTFDANGVSYSIGEGDIGKLDKLSQIASKMREGIKRIRQNGKKIFTEVTKKKGLKRKARQVEETIRNKISDIHKKVSKFLCTQYDVVILPEFRTQDMSRKRDNSGNWKRNITKTTTRKMIRWGHYNFRSSLINKGIQTGTKVVIGTEEYTSKTCTNCLKINYNLGSNKIFECPSCSHVLFRDVNGARNILLKNWKRAGLSYKPVRLVTIKNFGLPSSQATVKVQTNCKVLKLSV